MDASNVGIDTCMSPALAIHGEGPKAGGEKSREGAESTNDIRSLQCSSTNRRWSSL
jgi:hypothetical protein